MRIAICVHGRFFAFDLGRALIERGHEVEILTNYPAWAAARFDLPRSAIRSCWPHGVAARIVNRAASPALQRQLEPRLHQWFGRWAARQLKGHRFDVVHVWSGVAEEILRARPSPGAFYQVVRGSAHIRVQARLLDQERTRTGMPQGVPSDWMIQREQREYALADQVLVLSEFARKSFWDEGFQGRVDLLLLGARLSQFRPSLEIVEARIARIRSGAPLRVLYVGTVSFRKGMWDLREALAALRGQPFEFRLVGAVSQEVAGMAASLRASAQVVGKVPQDELPAHHAWGDVFIFPTIEDGYPAVLAQAAAAGLPIITTTNCSGPELVREGETGFIVPIRSAPSLIEKLRWCGTHRSELAQMARQTYVSYAPRDWPAVAADFERVSWSAIESRLAKQPHR